MRRRTRRALLGAALVPIVAIALVTVLGVEVLLARRGTDLPQGPPLAHDGRIGGPGDALRMVWLGDSTAAGEGASSADAAIPRRVAVGLHRPVDLFVLAASGHRLADVLRYQLGRVAALDPDVVLVSVGANDVTHLTQKGTFHSEYERLVEGLPDDVRLVLLGVPDMGAPTRFAQPLRAVAGWRGRTLDGEARSVARDRGAVYVDIADRTGPAMRKDTARYFADDRYHPSDDGYRLWADAVLARLRPALATSSEGVVHGHR